MIQFTFHLHDCLIQDDGEMKFSSKLEQKQAAPVAASVESPPPPSVFDYKGIPSDPYDLVDYLLAPLPVKRLKCRCYVLRVKKMVLFTCNLVHV